MMNGRFVFTVLFAVVAMAAHALDAKGVLDKVYAEYKKCPSITADFVIRVGDDEDQGSVLLQGNKFRTRLSNHTTWFDGKTMWSYSKENEEVNVTEPTQAQLAKINPYAFLGIYKTGYEVKFGNNTKTQYEIILTATSPKSSIQKAIVRVNRFDNRPTYVMMGQSKGNVEISVTAYKKGSKQSDSAFRFNKKDYLKADVIDLR